MSRKCVLALFTIVLLSAGAADAQQTRPTPAPSGNAPNVDERMAADAARPPIPVKVQLVLSRWRDDKKVSSEPYTLIVNASQTRPMGELARIRMGAEVPVSAMSGTAELSKQTGVPAVAPVQYKAIGTNIDCMAGADPNGRFTLQVTIEDSSVYADDHPQPGTVASPTTPVFRSFRLTNTAVMRDGQSIQFSSAADKVSGDVVKVDVTLNVVK